MATVQLPAKRAPGAPWSLIALIAVGAIALVAVAALGYQAVSGGTASSPITIPGVSTTADSVTVVATGEVAAAPDMMTVYVGASVQRPTAREALQVASSEAAALADYLKQQGVDPKDIQTQYVNIWHGKDNNGQSYYTASNELRVVLRDLSKAGGIIAGAADTLGNDVTIGNISLERQDSTAQIAQARDLAMKTANTRADQWSKLTGRKLGNVLGVNEGSFGYSNYQPGQYGGGIGGGGGVPIETGQGTVSVQVAVTYRLD